MQCKNCGEEATISSINVKNKYLKNAIMVCFFSKLSAFSNVFYFHPVTSEDRVQGSSVTVYKREREVANALEKLASLQALPDLSPPMHQLLSLNSLLN